MAIIRPGRCYHSVKGKAYTRVAVRVPRKSYVKGVPGSKIIHFELGNKSEKNKFPVAYKLIADRPIQLRHNCMEAARIAATKELILSLGEMGFFFKVLTYPHQVMRNKPLATGAGADRFSQGMRRSFGKPLGKAARLKEGQAFMLVRVPAGKDMVAKESLRLAKMKLPGSFKIVAA